MNWHDYFTDGEILTRLSELTGEPIPARYKTDADISIELAKLIYKHPDVFRGVLESLDKTVEEYETTTA